jgi:uncharacterized protein (TIGR03083 family)
VSLRPPRPVPTAHLFTPLHEDLIRVLRPLDPQDWIVQATPGGWRVRDVAAHLLDGDLRRLSFQRDGHPPPEPSASPEDYDGIVRWLNQLNGHWIQAVERLSPAVLLELLEATGPRVGELFESLDLDAPALFPVTWAGQSESPNWLDVGREFVERWHHQQQIRDAVGAPPLTAPWMLGPLLAVSAHALPASYAREDLPLGTRVQIEVPGDHGGAWVVERGSGSGDAPLGGWRLLEGTVERPTLRVRMESALAWRVFLRHPSEKEIRTGMEVEGQVELVAPLLAARALMV